MDLSLTDDSDCDVKHQLFAVEFKRTWDSVGSEVVYILDESEIARRVAGVHCIWTSEICIICVIHMPSPQFRQLLILAGF